MVIIRNISCLIYEDFGDLNFRGKLSLDVFFLLIKLGLFSLLLERVLGLFIGKFC